MNDVKQSPDPDSTLEQRIEIIDLDSDELGEFDALAVCSCDGGGGGSSRTFGGFQVEVALAAIYQKDDPESLAKRFGVSVDDVYRWSEELVNAGKRRMLLGDMDETAAKLEVERLAQQVSERDKLIAELSLANRKLTERSSGEKK